MIEIVDTVNNYYIYSQVGMADKDWLFFLIQVRFTLYFSLAMFAKGIYYFGQTYLHHRAELYIVPPSSCSESGR